MSSNITIPTALFKLLIESAENAKILHKQPVEVQDQWGKVIDQTIASSREQLANQLAYDELNEIGSQNTAPTAGKQSFF